MLRRGLLLHSANGQRVFAEHFDSPRHTADLIARLAARDSLVEFARGKRLHPVRHAADRAGEAGADQPCQHGAQQQRTGRAQDHRLLRVLHRRRGLLTLFGARCAKLRADLADLLVDRGAGFRQLGLLRAQIAGHLDHLVERSRVSGDRCLQCRDQRLQFGFRRAGNFGLGVGDCELDVRQRELGIVGIRSRQRVGRSASP